MAYVIQDVVTGRYVKKTDGTTWPVLVSTDSDIRWSVRLDDSGVRRYKNLSAVKGQLTCMIQRIECDLEHYENGEWEAAILEQREKARTTDAADIPHGAAIWKTVEEYVGHCTGLVKHYEGLYQYGAEAFQRKHIADYGLVIVTV